MKSDDAEDEISINEEEPCNESEEEMDEGKNVTQLIAHCEDFMSTEQFGSQN